MSREKKRKEEKKREKEEEEERRKPKEGETDGTLSHCMVIAQFEISIIPQ